MKHFFSTVASLVRKNALLLAVLGLGAGAAIAYEGVAGEMELGSPVALDVYPEDNDQIAPVSIAGDGIWIFSGEREIMPAHVDGLLIEIKNMKGAVVASWDHNEVSECGVWVDAMGNKCAAGEGTCIGYKIGTDNENILSNGHYTFVIPEGFFHVTVGGGDDVQYCPNEAVEFTWTLYDPDTHIDLSVEPQGTDESDPENAWVYSTALEQVVIFAGEDANPLDMHPSHNDEMVVSLTNAKGVELATFSQDELQDALVFEGEWYGLGVRLNLMDYVTATGQYTLNIPAGTFNIAVEGMEGYTAPNAATEISWFVKVPANLTVLPEATSEEDPENLTIDPVALEQVQICSDPDMPAEMITANKDDLFITLTNARGNQLAEWNYEEVRELGVVDGDICQGFVLNVAEHVTASGYYTLDIPEGFFEVAAPGTDGVFTPNAAKSVTWLVVPVQMELSVLPAATDESELDNASIAPVALEQTMLYAEVGGEQVEMITANNDELFITLSNSKGVELVRFNALELINCGVVDNDVCLGYNLKLDEYVTATGYYTLNVPAGFFEVNVGMDGVFSPNAALEVKWLVIDPDLKAEINVEPQATSLEDPENLYVAPVALEEVQIFAGEGVNEEIILNHVDDLYITLNNAKGVELAQFNYSEVLEGAVYDNDVCVGFKLNVAEHITAAGYYTLNIPEGFFDVADPGVEGLFLPNAEKSVTWLVKPPYVDVNVEPQATAPNDYIATTALEYVQIFFGEGVNEEILLNNVDDLFIVLSNSKGVELARWSADEVREGAVYNDDSLAIGYNLNIAEYITGAGVYTLTIPQGMFDCALGVEDMFSPNAEKVVTWFALDPNAMVDINVLPESTDESDVENASIAPVALEDVQIFAGEGINEEILLNNVDDRYITLTNAKGTELATFNYDEVREGAVYNEDQVCIGYKLNLADYVTAAGYYTLTIPAGMFDVADEGVEGLFNANAEKVVKWLVIDPNATCEISVEPQSTDEGDVENASIAPVALEEVQIFVGEGVGEEIILANNDELFITLTNAKGAQIAEWNADEVREGAVQNEEGLVIGYKLNVAEHITAAGYYTLNIPEGMFEVSMPSVVEGYFEPNAEKVVKWLVIDPDATCEINVEPQSTDEGEIGNASIAPVALEEVQIFAGEGINEEIILSNNDELFITLVNAKGTELASWSADEVRDGAVENEDGTVVGYTLNAAEYITASGYYTLNIPEGMFEVADPSVVEGYFVPNAAKEVKWLVIETETSIYVSPEDGESIANVALEKFYVAADYDAVGEILLSHDDSLFITLTNAKGVELNRWSQDEVQECAVIENDVCVGFTWDASESITAVGYYTVTIPAGFFEVAAPGLDGVFVPNAETVCEYDINIIDDETGIKALFNDVDMNNGFNVTTLNGVNVLRGGSSADVKNLENGLYIINGKKVMIRK